MPNTRRSGFTGARSDPITGAYPLGNGYRWHLPALMRFNAADDFSPFGAGGINAYAYCTGDPVNYDDPGGHVGIWGEIIEASFQDAVAEQRETRLPDAGSYQEAKQQYADDLAQYMQQAMQAQGASSPSQGGPAPPPPFAFDPRHEATKPDSLGPANAQAAAARSPAAGSPAAGSPAAGSPAAGPSNAGSDVGPQRVGTTYQTSMESQHARYATSIAAAIPGQELSFARILDEISNTPFYRLSHETRARQTMDRFIGVLEAHNIRASDLPDYEPHRIFRKFGFQLEGRPRFRLRSEIEHGRDVAANIRRLYWLGLMTSNPPA
ncbi:RHS repeat-associated core domain-containing protein [Bordetella bronchialis]|uniref:RHS repeat-associated core domain-containing protein n=1 Tax=Bordetella bronchialis TaxID=463025 RepID=A0A193FZX9_9BORD|nr:RHS repeat-associated core domain-containing protein [Bordetella bronchialis]ANN72544.1 hypothetical protein BAU08_15360 [Bordetella bronchialis]